MDDESVCMVSGLLGGVFIGLVIGMYMIPSPFNLSNDTLNDICHNLGFNDSVAHSENGKLICEVPSYDSTTNIILRKAGESP